MPREDRMAGCALLAISGAVTLLTSGSLAFGLYFAYAALTGPTPILIAPSDSRAFLFLGVVLLCAWIICNALLSTIEAEPRVFRIAWLAVFFLFTTPLPIAMIVEHFMRP